MADKALPVTTSADFPGRTDVPRSGTNLQPGSGTEQMNACSILEGELAVRRGVKEVYFEAS